MDGERLAGDADQDILASGWNEWCDFNIFARPIITPQAFYCLKSMSHEMAEFSGEGAYVSPTGHGGTDCYSGAAHCCRC